VKTWSWLLGEINDGDVARGDRGARRESVSGVLVEGGRLIELLLRDGLRSVEIEG
jgi:hypothetical protein